MDITKISSEHNHAPDQAEVEVCLSLMPEMRMLSFLQGHTLDLQKEGEQFNQMDKNYTSKFWVVQIWKLWFLIIRYHMWANFIWHHLCWVPNLKVSCFL